MARVFMPGRPFKLKRACLRWRLDEDCLAVFDTFDIYLREAASARCLLG